MIQIQNRMRQFRLRVCKLSELICRVGVTQCYKLSRVECESPFRCSVLPPHFTRNFLPPHDTNLIVTTLGHRYSISNSLTIHARIWFRIEYDGLRPCKTRLRWFSWVCKYNIRLKLNAQNPQLYPYQQRYFFVKPLFIPHMRREDNSEYSCFIIKMTSPDDV